MQSVSYNKQLVSNTFPYWPATENTFLEISIKMIVVGNLTGFLMDINTWNYQKNVRFSVFGGYINVTLGRNSHNASGINHLKRT